MSATTAQAGADQWPAWTPAYWHLARHSGLLGTASVVCLLTYPWPTAWLGLFGLLLLWLIRVRSGARARLGLALLLPLLLFFLGALVGLYATVAPSTAQVRFFGILAAIGAFVLVFDAVASTPVVLRLARFALWAALLLLPPLFVIVVPELNLSRLPSPLASALEVWMPSLDYLRREIVQVEELRQRYRLYPSGLGLLGAYGVGLTLGPLLTSPSRRGRLLAGLAAGYCLLFVLLSANRGSLISALLASLVLGVCCSRLLRLALLGMLLGGGAIVAARMASGSSPLASGPALLPPQLADPGPLHVRLEYWRNALFMLGDFPLSGVGLGLESVRAQYESYFLTRSAGDHGGFPFGHAHNMVVQTWLEQGPLGLAGLLGIVAVPLVIAWPALARPTDPRARSVAVSALGACLALLFTGLTEVAVLTTVGLVLLFGTLAVLAGRTRAPSSASACFAPRRRLKHALAVAPIVAILLLAVEVPLLLEWREDHRFGTAPGFLAALPTTVQAQWDLNLGTLAVSRGRAAPQGSEEQRSLSDAAGWHLERALSLDPENPRIHRNLAAAALLSSGPSDALVHLRKAERRTSRDDSQGQFQLGRLYQQADEIERAVLAWSRVRLLRTEYRGPGRPFGAWSGAGADSQLVVWGRRLVEQRRWREAEAVNRAAIKAAPHLREPYQAYALATAEHKGHQAALRELRELSREYRDIPWSYDELARLSEQAGLHQEAATWRERAARVRASPAWAMQWRPAPAASSDGRQ
jgi:O-antigen ligase/tetratricopeptide (TPR) repeat protein